MSVNVSPRHALQGDLATSVERALASTGFDPGSLLVELTESERIEDVAGLASVLGAVRELGVSVALDDFGTGWSTLGLLRRVPFDALKIDRSFTAGLPGSRSDRALVAAIVTLARSLGVPAVAEGIERPEQHAWLRDVGCDLGQGYLFARPSTVEQLAGWLAQREPPVRGYSSAQSCLTFSQSASAGLRLGGRKRQPGKARAGGVNAPRSTSRSMLPR